MKFNTDCQDEIINSLQLELVRLKKKMMRMQIITIVAIPFIVAVVCYTVFSIIYGVAS